MSIVFLLLVSAVLVFISVGYMSKNRVWLLPGLACGLLLFVVGINPSEPSVALGNDDTQIPVSITQPVTETSAIIPETTAVLTLPEKEVLYDSDPFEYTRDNLIYDNGALRVYYMTLHEGERYTVGRLVGVKHGKTVIDKRETWACTKPVWNAEGTAFAYIDSVEFESIGNLFVYTLGEMEEQITTYEYGYGEDPTAKDFAWLSEDQLLLIAGYPYGTITQGGALYLCDLTKETVELILEPEEDREFTDVEIEDGQVLLTTVYWTDENYMAFDYEDQIISIEALIGQ